MKKRIYEAFIPKAKKDLKIKYSKAYEKADDELNAYIKKILRSKEQQTELLVFIAKLLLISEADAYIQGMNDGFDYGADFMQNVKNYLEENK
jgi:hypothetical protein